MALKIFISLYAINFEKSKTMNKKYFYAISHYTLVQLIIRHNN